MNSLESLEVLCVAEVLFYVPILTSC